MILDVPSASEFESNGIAFLNLAWESAIELSVHLDEVLQELDLDTTLTTAELLEEKEKYTFDFWEKNRQNLGVAVALTQQGAEFFLKWRICCVSPYLLLAGDTSGKWTGVDKYFADFKTIDAQDLIRIHDTVTSQKLSEQFKQQFEHLRRIRNAVMHSVDRRHVLSAKAILLSILETSSSIVGPQSWQRLRQGYYNDKESVLGRHYYHYTDDRLARETHHVLTLLTPAQIKKYFDFNPKQRCYFCPSCRSLSSDVGLEFKLAQLKPNDASSTNLFCVACGDHNLVVRAKCFDPVCKGNVLNEDSEVCLTCNQSL